MKNAEKREIVKELEGIFYILSNGTTNNDSAAIETAEHKLKALMTELRNDIKENR